MNPTSMLSTQLHIQTLGISAGGGFHGLECERAKGTSSSPSTCRMTLCSPNSTTCVLMSSIPSSNTGRRGKLPERFLSASRPLRRLIGSVSGHRQWTTPPLGQGEQTNWNHNSKMPAGIRNEWGAVRATEILRARQKKVPIDRSKIQTV